MAQDPEQLRAEIARTRDDLGQDLDVLAEKVTPSKIVDRRVEAARSAVGGLKDRVMGSVNSLTSTAGEVSRDAAGTVSDRAGQTASAVQAAPDQMKARTSGNPFAAGIIAFGLGLLVASLIPASDTEARATVKLKDAAQPVLDPLKDQASQAMSEVKQNLTPALQDAAGSLKDTATDSVGTVKESASDAAATVKDQTADSTATVKDATTDAAETVKDQATDSAETVADQARSSTSAIRSAASSTSSTGTPPSPGQRRP